MEMSKKVAVVVPWHGYGRNMLLGVSRFVLDHPEWVLHLIQSDSPVVEEDLREWNPDGIISGILDTDEGTSELHFRRPWVSVLAQPDDEKIPFVTLDEDAVGRMAAEYFLDRRFAHFGFLGNSEQEFSVQRAEAFEYALQEQGFECSTLLHFSKFHDADKQRRIDADRLKAEWIQSLPKPAAVLACNDWEAFQLIQFCRQQGIRIPEEVAVMGIGNDELLCNISNPPMSSIRLPEERIGYNAAQMLDWILDGKKPGGKSEFLAPVGLVSRMSSDVLEVGDPAVSVALRFIKNNISRTIKVQDVLEHTGISRTLLENKFKKSIGRSPLQEIRRQRVRTAQQLLADTDLSIAAVAAASGFGSDIRLSTVFKEITGTPPSLYRKQIRIPSNVFEV